MKLKEKLKYCANKEFGVGKLEFCPKCEGLLMPKKQKSKTVFYCPHCGFEQKPKKKTANDYKVVWKIEHTPKDEIIVVEGPKKLGKKDKELMKEKLIKK